MPMMLWSVPEITTSGRVLRPVDASLYPPYPNTAAAVEEVRGSGAADVGPYFRHLHAVMTAIGGVAAIGDAGNTRKNDFTSSKEERTARSWVRRLQPGVWGR